jgi:hypothetical protein
MIPTLLISNWKSGVGTDLATIAGAGGQVMDKVDAVGVKKVMSISKCEQ